jgi:transketolase
MIPRNVKKVLSSENKKIATRDAYGTRLAEVGELNDDIVVLDSDLSTATGTYVFAKKYPDRFFNFGVAEANMMGAAAGLATFGLIPFVSTFAVFASRRACDQVAISISYPNLNVKICASHSGISVGEDGPTHQAIEDIAIMRSIPGITVLSPCDEVETRKVIDKVIEYKGPCYIRLCRIDTPSIFNSDYDFEIGKGIRIMEGGDATIVCTGFTTHIALEAAMALEKDGIEVDLINMASIKPIDKDLILESAKKTNLVITIEDHSIIGGLGCAVSDVLSETNPVKILKLGVQDRFGSTGPPYELVSAYGFDEQSLINIVKKNVRP